MRNFWKENIPGIVATIIIVVVSYLLVQIDGCDRHSKSLYKREMSTSLSWKNDSLKSQGFGTATGRRIRSLIEFEAAEIPAAARDSLHYVLQSHLSKLSGVDIYACRDTLQVARLLAAVGRCMSSEVTDWFSDVGDSARALPREFQALSFSTRPVGTFYIAFHQLQGMNYPDYVRSFLVDDSLKAARHYLGDIRAGELVAVNSEWQWFPRWYLISLWVLCSLILVMVPILRDHTDFTYSDIQPTVGWSLTLVALAPGWAVVGLVEGTGRLVKPIGRFFSFNPVEWWRGRKVRMAAAILPAPRQRVPSEVTTPGEQPVVAIPASVTTVSKSTQPPQRWFFIRSFTSHLPSLESQGIRVREITLPTTGMRGLVFPENEVDLVAKELGLRLDPETAEPTTREYVYALFVDSKAESRLRQAKQFASQRDQVRSQYVEAVQSRLSAELSTVAQRLEDYEHRRREISREIIEAEPWT